MTQASQILENKQLKLVETILPRINKKAAVLFINKKLGNPWLYLRLFVVCSVGWMMSHDFGLQVNHSFIISCSVKLFTSSTQLKNDKGQTSGHCLNRWGLPNSSMFWPWYILVVPPWVVSLSLSPSLSLRHWRVSVCETGPGLVFLSNALAWKNSPPITHSICPAAAHCLHPAPAADRGLEIGSRF